MKPAISKASLPPQAWAETLRKQQRRAQQASDKLAAIKTKRAGQLSAADRTNLIEVIALRMGIIEPD